MVNRIPQKWVVAALVIIATALGGCSTTPPPITSSSNSTPPPAEATPKPQINMGDMAEEIAKGVGSVQRTVGTGEKGPIFVFEEFHTSRIGQLQIAIMLLRLHEKYGLKTIGLEGSIKSDQPLDAAWFRGMGGDESRRDREDVSVRWLAEGEIGSSEFMALNFSDLKVYGIEDAAEYDVEPPRTDAVGWYLAAIAQQSMSATEKEALNNLVRQGQTKEALEFAANADPWVKERYEVLKKQSLTSSDEEVRRAEELKNRARQVRAQLPPEAERALDDLVYFYQTADKRSSTMVNHTLERASDTSGSPVAMTIGAAHTRKVAELLAQSNVAFAVIRPNDLNPKHGTMTPEQFSRKSHGKWARNGPGTLGQLLNGSRKPSPILERTSAHSYASMLMSVILLARAGRSGGGNGGPFPPANVWSRLSGLPDIRIDRASFSRDGYDVIYRAWLKQDSGGEKEVWARVGTLSQSPNANSLKTLEQKLLQACGDLRGGGGNNIPPNDLPPNSQGADDEGPRDAKRNDLLISRTGKDSLAVFASSHTAVLSAGQISD
jgi:hypothetical protein